MDIETARERVDFCRRDLIDATHRNRQYADAVRLASVALVQANANLQALSHPITGG